MTPPVKIGPYLVERELGRGGMGVVYLARDPRLDRMVAIKALAAPVAADPGRMARFRAEARLVAQLNHPHIAQIHDAREEEGRLYLVLEYVPGESLADRLARGLMEAGDAMSVCAQVARAVGAAHARGVVHRDLKPDNIRVTPEGTAKVLDFGIAKALGPDGGEAAATESAQTTADTAAPQTHAGMIVGTPGYMSPEQARGRGVEKRADIWAFGCILYECLSGRRAFHGPSMADTLAATLVAEPDWGALPSAVLPAVLALLRQCLVKDTEGRLGDIAEAGRLLDEALGRRSAPAGPTVVVGPARSTPNNLPRQLTAFIGRADQIAALRAMVVRCPLVTLTGAGGCGKTRLALRLASEVLGEFPAGVHLAELAALHEATQVAGAVASVRAVRDQPGRPLTRSIAESIGEGRALLILDNCEHLRGACASLAQSLLDECPNLRIVATGREALGIPGETTWLVPSLSLPPATDVARAPATPGSGTMTPPPSRTFAAAIDQYESVALFCDRARAVKPSFALTPATGPVVGRICRRLDGIPLAIELAAARIKLLTPEQILAKLDDRFRLLTAGAGAAVERHQTLRATIDWSFAMLTAEEAALLSLLSVFAGGWTLEAAARLADSDEFEALERLTRLVDKSLVVVEEGAIGAECRYRLLETVRQYAGEKLAEAGGTEAARERHRAFYLEMAQSANPELQGPGAKGWLDRLEAEHENLLAAIAHGCSDDKPVRLAMLLGRYWHMRGHAGVGRTALADALARGGASVPPSVRARAMNVAVILAHAQGDVQAAKGFQAEGLAIYRELGDRHGQAASLNNLGGVVYHLGDLPGARALFEEALTINRELGNTAWAGSNLSNLGMLARCLGNLDQAGAYDEQALVIARESGNAQSVASALLELALVAQARGELGAARPLQAESLTIRRGLDDRHGLAESLQAVAGLAADGRSREGALCAARLFGAAERLREEIGAPVHACDRARHERGVDAARAALDAAEFAGAWAAGREGTLGDALIAGAEWLDAGAAPQVRLPQSGILGTTPV